MIVEGQSYRTVWAEGSALERPAVKMIDQKLLPFAFAIHRASTLEETCTAIRDMTVRGAGAIGATAGYAMAQGVFQDDWDIARSQIEATRPTAQNLFYATKRVYEAAEKSSANSIQAARSEAQAIADEDADNCRQIGEHGSILITPGTKMMTQCNAGWLAFVDWGSALSPLYVAKEDGVKDISVIANYTSPRGQGGRLTAWELENEGIQHQIAPDTAVSYLMEHGMVNLVIVGSDRIAANGDVANKIGTQNVARLAMDFGIPFYVAAPTSTIDHNCPSGKDIPIEQRHEDEVLYQTGPDEKGKMRKIRVTAPNSHALNPSFDVTPAHFIRGIITEKGIITPTRNEIARLAA